MEKVNALPLVMNQCKVPYENISLLLNHDEVYAVSGVFTHKRVRYEVEEDVGKQASGLRNSQVMTLRVG